MREGSTAATAISLSDDEDAVFRIETRLPARKATREDDELEEGEDMDISFGGAYLSLKGSERESAPVDLGDFSNVYALLQAEREKLEQIQIVRRQDRPDVIRIPQSTPAKKTAPTRRTSVVGKTAQQAIDIDAMDMTPLKEVLDSLSSSMAPKQRAAIAPIQFSKGVIAASKPSPTQETIRSAVPPHVTDQRATTSSAPPTPALTSDADTSIASSSHQPSPLSFTSRYARSDYDDEQDQQSRRQTSPKLPMPVRERATSLLQKLGREFPDERQIFARAEALGAMQPPEGTRPSVYIHVDFSNVHVGFLEWCRSRGLHDPKDRYRRRPKLDLHSLFAILERGRAARRRILVGSRPLAQGLELADDWHYELLILDRVRKRHVPRAGFATDSGGSADDSSDADGHHQVRRTTMREQAVDEVLQLKLYETVTRPPSSQQRAAGRPVVVLATGDGNRSEFSDGFIAPVRIALAAGFDVELFSFRAGLSSAWHAERKRAEPVAGQTGRLFIHELDFFGDELVAS